MNNKTIFRWVGGKLSLKDVIYKEFPKEYNNYHEPFLGAGSIFFKTFSELNVLPHFLSKQMFLSDINFDVINFYNCLANKKEELYSSLIELSDLYFATNDEEKRKELFLEIRGLDRNSLFEDLSDVKKAARFLFLTKTSFNGLCRYSKKNGYYNSPFGYLKKPNIFNEKDLDYFHNILKNENIIIKNQDFESSKKLIKKGDLVFIDPPYIPLSKTSSFTSYHKSGFDINDHIRVKEYAEYINSIGAYFIQTNTFCELTKEMYKDFNLKEIKVDRKVNRTGKGDIKVSEYLIKNF